ncbi:HEPN domain-containing protein [Flavobacterium sp. ALJ2]|uniref:HEPN domain-containing protein n=1 Tax=Flavobacterium sp. ALJ2 TaxID=2786960 RepID=UPI00189E117A|nr:HEPN domain-containing protein [Flavobacterium sp. ALJ2]MBF7093442.1 HEPN domain-containing protein [Flavobacterium sp. ALJ2]
MKKSIAYLPQKKQRDLLRFVEQITARLPKTQMIILYGSYARNEYVDCDEKVEFGIPTSYRSDYDILVVTDGVADQRATRMLDAVDDMYYRDPDLQTPVEFIHENIKRLNEYIDTGRYFYTQIKEEGIVLYDSEKFTLAEQRPLRFDEIKQQAEEYFKDKYESANEFFEIALYSYEKELYKKASFLLHQACENYFQTIRLVHTLTNPKQHNLSKLFSFTRKYSSDLPSVFPNDTIEEKRLFELLKSAYIEARYNPKFIVTKEDIDALLPKVKRLLEITKQVSEAKIAEYAKLIKA